MQLPKTPLPPLRGPGIAKTRGLPLVSNRIAHLTRANDAIWRILFDAADTISEGSVRNEPPGESTWFGSTSLILRMPELASRERSEALRVGEHDVHVRLRAMRLAHREAVQRAPGSLGTATCEIRFALAPEGVRIDVDLQAPLSERRRQRDSSATTAVQRREL
jgi:hypothetical protein